MAITPEHTLIDAGIDEQGLTDLRKGMSGTERLFRALKRESPKKLDAIARKVRLGKMHPDDIVEKLENMGKFETMVARIQAGEFR